MTLYKSIFTLLVALVVFGAPVLAVAQQGTFDPNAPQGTFDPGRPQGTYNPSQPQGSNQFSIQNPLNNDIRSFCGLIKLLFSVLLQLGIPVAVVFIVLAGARFVFAQGNVNKLAEARTTLLYTVIGVALFLGAWLIIMAVAATLETLGVAFISCA